MSATTLILIAAIAPTITGIFAMIAAWTTYKAVKEVHISLNSRLSQLLDSTAKEQHAAGVVEGKAQK
jgi:hypothetical protein